MKKFTLLSLMIVITALFTSHVLNGQITFEKTFENFASDVVDIEETPDNGYILLTRHEDLSGFLNYLIKTDEVGEIIWTQTFDLGLNNICNSDEGGYFAVGGYLGIGYISDPDSIVMKLDENGDMLWQSDDEYLLPTSIVPSNDGNYVFGYYQQWPGFYPALAKINDDGDSLWTQLLPVENSNLITDIEKINDGFAVVGHNYDSSFIIKTNFSGLTEWVVYFDSIRLLSVCQNDDMGLIGVGYSGNSLGSQTIVIRIDSLGNLIWEKSYSYGYVGGYSICQTSDGNNVMAVSEWGSSSGSSTLVKIDNYGEIIWEKSYGNGLRDVKLASDDGIIAGGSNSKVYIVKTDENGLITSLNDRNYNNQILLKIHPNPTTGKAIINFELEERKEVTLIVQNICGKEKERILFGNKMIGNYEMNCDKYSPGIYLISLKTDSGIQTKKLIIE